MSRFREEVEIVPRPAFAIAVCVWLAFFLLMMLLPFRIDPEGRNWPLAGKLAVSVLPGLPLFVMVLLVGYVYSDAKRRGMRYVWKRTDAVPADRLCCARSIQTHAHMRRR